MSIAVTQGIEVNVRNRYLADQSDPDQDSFLFAYDITICNNGTQSAQLLTRHWVIKDALGRVEEVQGEGVVGQTPVIKPGQSFTYSSCCPLRTIYGSMRGSYGMTRPNGETFEAQIAPFALMPPAMLN